MRTYLVGSGDWFRRAVEKNGPHFIELSHGRLFAVVKADDEENAYVAVTRMLLLRGETYLARLQLYAIEFDEDVILATDG